jgi:MAC/Perforin domain
VVIYKRRGGRDIKEISHREWLNTVQGEPDVISMSFLPITSLLSGVPGSGFLNHAINLYLRCNNLFFLNISIWSLLYFSLFCS